MATFQGYVESVNDALLLIQACKVGLLNPIYRRLNAAQRADLASGQIFVYNEQNSGIKRWYVRLYRTDGEYWGPSRSLGAFLIYKQLQVATTPQISRKTAAIPKPNGSSSDSGLLKRTLTASVEDVIWHVCGYYTLEDLEFARLERPSQCKMFSNMEIPNAVVVTHSRKSSSSDDRRRRPSRQPEHQALESDEQPTMPTIIPVIPDDLLEEIMAVPTHAIPTGTSVTSTPTDSSSSFGSMEMGDLFPAFPDDYFKRYIFRNSEI